jgi:hypothetical protein
VRKTHNGGRKHKDNVREYFEAWYKDHYDVLVASGIHAVREFEIEKRSSLVINQVID